MRKILFALFIAVMLAACTSKIYNSALKQIELGMTQQEVVSLMGNDYTTVDERGNEKTIEYVDRFKNHWFFQFSDGYLNKWHKEVEK